MLLQIRSLYKPIETVTIANTNGCPTFGKMDAEEPKRKCVVCNTHTFRFTTMLCIISMLREIDRNISFIQVYTFFHTAFNAFISKLYPSISFSVTLKFCLLFSWYECVLYTIYLEGDMVSSSHIVIFNSIILL